MKKLFILVFLFISYNVSAADVIAVSCECEPYCIGKFFDINKEKWEDAKVSDSETVFLYKSGGVGVDEGVMGWRQPSIDPKEKSTSVFVWKGEVSAYNQNSISFLIPNENGSMQVYTYFPQKRKMIEVKTNDFMGNSYGQMIYYDKCSSTILSK